MKIIDEYRRLTEEIAVLESRIISQERQLRKVSDIYAPAGVSSLDYSKERVAGGPARPDMIGVAGQIIEITIDLNNDRAELKDLHTQRDKLREVIGTLGCRLKKVLMYKIEGCSNNQIATRLGCSKRHVERLVSEMREKVEKI